MCFPALKPGARAQRRETAHEPAGPEDLPDAHRVRKAVHAERPAIAILEQTAGETARGVGDDDGTGFGERLMFSTAREISALSSGLTPVIWTLASPTRTVATSRRGPDVKNTRNPFVFDIKILDYVLCYSENVRNDHLEPFAAIPSSRAQRGISRE